MELGERLPDVCSCFLPLPIQKPTSAALWVPGPQVPRFGAEEAGLPFSHPRPQFSTDGDSPSFHLPLYKDLMLVSSLY